MPSLKSQRIINILKGDKNASILSELEMLNDSLVKSKNRDVLSDKIGVAIDYLRLLTEYIRPLKQLKGDKGDTGVIGDTGQSIQGEKGETGDTGLRGVKGDRGDKGNQGKSIAGPRGDKGEIGNEGPQGSEGPIGKMPKHEYKYGRLRFENQDGTWGAWIDIGAMQLGGKQKTLHRGGIKMAYNETPSGTVDGINDTLTLEFAPIDGSLMLFVNGARQFAGAGNDFTVSSQTITFATPPPTDSNIIADYQRA